MCGGEGERGWSCVETKSGYGECAGVQGVRSVTEQWGKGGGGAIIEGHAECPNVNNTC